MQCPQCGRDIHGKALFCPNCGHRLEQEAAPTKRRRSARSGGAAEPERSGCGRSLLVLLTTLLVIVAIAGIGAAAVYYGLRDRANVEHQAAGEHYSKGLAHLEQEQYELAIAEFELVLQLDPENEPALTKLAETKSHLREQSTPTAVLQKETAAAYYERLQKAFDAKDWPNVLAEADRLLALDPDYRRGDVDQMLFAAFVATGQQLADQDRLEEAIRLFDRALQLQPDNAQVQHARNLATLYVDALGYWGADWEQTTAQFAKLYELAPEYKDVAQRLHDAHVAQADYMGKQGDWCAAAEEYAAALGIQAAPDIVTRRQDALAKCQQQPTATPEGGTPTPTQPSEPAVPTGTFVGRLVERTGIASSKMYVRGKVLDGAGKGIQDIQVKIQAWDWSAIAVTDGNGQYAFDGLANPVTYTLSLVDISSYPFDIEGQWGKIAWVYFQQAK